MSLLKSVSPSEDSVEIAQPLKESNVSTKATAKNTAESAFEDVEIKNEKGERILSL